MNIHDGKERKKKDGLGRDRERRKELGRRGKRDKERVEKHFVVGILHGSFWCQVLEVSRETVAGVSCVPSVYCILSTEWCSWARCYLRMSWGYAPFSSAKIQER